MQLLSSVLEYVGVVYAWRHEFLSTNGSLAAQPLNLTVPGSCLYQQADSRGLGSTQRTRIHGCEL
jgi:hypothetical protein